MVNCSHGGIGITQCSHANEVAVICYGVSTAGNPTNGTRMHSLTQEMRACILYPANVHALQYIRIIAIECFLFLSLICLSIYI